MKIGKPKSKRVPVRLRHKIEKASAAKQRKQRKLAKQNPQWRSRLKKDPGIPNLFPYKDKILHEIEEKKRLKEEEAARRREDAKARRLGTAVEGLNGEAQDAEQMEEEDEDVLFDEELDDQMGDVEQNGANPMAALLESARARAVDFDTEHAEGSDEEEMDDEHVESWDGLDERNDVDSVIAAPAARKDTSRKAFDKVFKQVVEAADVILYVLDARDPEGTRSKEVERTVMAADGGSKRLILVLNKIDLIPPAVLKAWLIHLRRYFPTLPLRASTPASNAQVFDHKQLSVKGTSETLLRALKTYASGNQLKRAITVGVIGYPNVGKSSVINALTSRLGGKSAPCPVGAEAGVTTSLREVKLDNKLKLLDSPGIVFPTATDGSRARRNDERARLILLNAVPPKEIEDPIPAVSLLLRRLGASDEMMAKLRDVYGIPPLVTTDGDRTTDFLVQVARKRGRLGKGGVPNLHGAAQNVLADWRAGRIHGWIEAPVQPVAVSGAQEADDTVGDRKEIVKEWAEEFKIEGLWGDGTVADSSP